MTTPSPDPAADPRLDAAIAEFLEALDHGEAPDRDAILAANPDLAEPLRAFFADHDRMRDLAGPPGAVEAADDPFLAPTSEHNGAGPSRGTRLKYVGDYEILDEIAQGGMGVVYRARQMTLNRTVAVKMILAGVLAGPEAVRRFRQEAEAAAGLDHPQIVPIFEVGAHEGQPYFSMKLIAGPSLAEVLVSDRRPARRELVRLLAEVARAVDHAHRRGILHRDLKPRNILLDEAGHPHVTDFGLARRLESESDLTGSGTPGTPSYMAPEQARGDRRPTTAVDVYGLGALLYEVLTGRPPHRAETPVATLRLVLESDPIAPRTLDPTIDRDLETIALKCLEKDPRRRYDSASSLAAELDRWLRGEPITARPVGRVEKGWRWCKRNPVIASLTAAVAASLLLGAAISTAFAVAEYYERIRAEKAEKVAIDARDDAEKALAQSIIGTLALDGLDYPGFPGSAPYEKGLSVLEIESLWKLAERGGNRLWFRFLDEATQSPLAVQQLCSRSGPALIAAVGLDHAKGDRASYQLVGKLHDPTVPLWQKADLALVALELEDLPNATTRECVSIVLRAIRSNPPTSLRDRWKYTVAARNDRLETRTSADLLLGLMLTPSIYDQAGVSLMGIYPPVLADLLTSTATRMEPREGARTLADALAKVADASVRNSLASGLASVTGRLEQRDAARVCGQAARTLVDALANEKNAWDRVSLASGLASIAGQLEPSEAARVCGQVARTLVDALANEKNADHRNALAGGLVTIAAPLDPGEAKRVWTEGARILADALAKETNANERGFLAAGLKTLTRRLESHEKERAPSRFMVREMGVNDNVIELFKAVRGLEPHAATRMLVNALAKETDAEARKVLAEKIVSVAGRLAQFEAARICDETIQALRRARAEEAEKDLERTESVTWDEAILLTHLDPDQARELARDLASFLCAAADGDPYTLDLLLSDASRDQWRRRMAEAWAAGAVDEEWAGLILTAPWPCRLTTQELVELLKMPTCLGGVRRVVLDHLGNRYGRRFANHWEFVRFAESRRLDLDFKTPPRRPRPAALGR